MEAVQAQQVQDTLAPAAVFSVKSRETARAAEDVSLSDLPSAPLQMTEVLQRFTGVQVKDYGGVGGLKTVNVRSLGSEHTGIFLDGIQVDNAQNMQVDLSRFSPEQWERIRLYNGNKSLRLQTAKEYAAGSALYLDSGIPDLPDGSQGTARLSGGWFGTIHPYIRWDKAFGRARRSVAGGPDDAADPISGFRRMRRAPLVLRLSADYTQTNGRYPFSYFDTTLVRENGDLKSLRIEAALYGRVRGGEWNIRLYSYGSERGFPGPVIRRAMGFPFSAERQADRDIFVQGTWTQEWSARYGSALRFKYANNYTHYATHPEKNPMALYYDLHYRQQSAYLSWANSWALLDFWALDFSTDAQYNKLDADVAAFVHPQRVSAIAALATRFHWEKANLAAHLVYQGAWDGYDAKNAGAWTRENTFRQAWMPSLSAFYRPLEWLEMDAFAKLSYRLPTFNDLYYALIGNTNLRPESAMQLGLNLYFQLRTGPWTASLRLSPYFNRVRDKIVAIPTSSQFRWSMLNIGIVEVLGGDVKAAGGYWAGDWRCDLTLRYSYQRALDRTNPDNQTYGNQIPYIPLHSASVDASVVRKGWSLVWNTLFTGTRWSRTANIPEYEIKPWTITDLRLGKEFMLPRWKDGTTQPSLSLGVSFNNIFNRSYQIVQGYPMPGFNMMFSVTFKW